jgi:hypothetical protein
MKNSHIEHCINELNGWVPFPRDAIPREAFQREAIPRDTIQ